MEPPPDAPTELPLLSKSALAKATGIALLIAMVMLVFIVLPAEYDIDPTGFGEAIGLTHLSADTADTAGTAERGAQSESVAAIFRDDRVVVEVPGGKGVEYKFYLRAGQKMKYSWEDPSGNLYYDFHGEPEGDTTDFFESYAESTASSAKGTFTAPFTGSHGWYWKNTSVFATQVTLETSGSYEVLGLR
jgi:hypothetical protein